MTRLIHWWLRRFEADFGYDATYLHDVVDGAGVLALLRFGLATMLGNDDRDVPEHALHAARIAAIAAEDCGPCTQLCVEMAARAGVPPTLVAAVVRGDDDALPDDARIAARFARAAVLRSDALDACREAALARFGRRGVVTLAYTATAAGLYPGLKYALGYGHACTLVRVGDTIVPKGLPVAASSAR